MSKSIATVPVSGTFQTWLNKTNEMVGVFNSDVITASPSGDSTTGNATLVGDFIAANLTGSTKINTPSIGNPSAGNSITVTEPLVISGQSQLAATFTFPSTGGQTRYTNGSLSWDIGMEDANGNFIMNTGGGTSEFSLTPQGGLTTASLVATGDLNALTATIGTLTVSTEIVGLSTDNVSEAAGATYSTGTQYFTRARAQDAFTAGDGIDFTSITNAVQSISVDMAEVATGISLSNYYTANSAIEPASMYVNTASGTADVIGWEFAPKAAYTDSNNYAYMKGGLSGGSPYLRFYQKVAGVNNLFVDMASGGFNCYKSAYFYSDINIYNGTGGDKTVFIDVSAGSIVAEGDITAYGSASDIRLKENIEIIPNALHKVSQLNGYTFNYKDKPEVHATGLIAQEVEKVLPGVVYDVESDGESYKALRYGNTVGLLVEAIKELQDRIIALEKSAIKHSS